MTTTRDALSTSNSNTRWLLSDPADANLLPGGPPAANPFGFALGDTIEARRSRGAPAGMNTSPTGSTGSTADPSLARLLQTHRQQAHQTEMPARARTARAAARPADGPTSTAPIRVRGKTYKPGQGDRLWLDLETRGHSYRKWARRNPALAKRIGRPRRVYRMIKSVRRSLNRVDSPLAKYAKNFVVAGKLSGYDPRFIASFAALESGWGRSTPSNAPYNFWGWTVYTGNQNSAVTSPFKKPGRAFRYFGRQLGKKYGGAKSAYSRIWAPYAADPSHEAKIASILRQYFGGNPNNIRFKAALTGRT